MLTKNAVGNLINRYKTVLAHCRLLNILGTLALAAGLTIAPSMGPSLSSPCMTPLFGTSDAMAAEMEYWPSGDSSSAKVEYWASGDFSSADFSNVVIQPHTLSVAHVGIVIQFTETLNNAVGNSLDTMITQMAFLDENKGTTGVEAEQKEDTATTNPSFVITREDSIGMSYKDTEGSKDPEIPEFDSGIPVSPSGIEQTLAKANTGPINGAQQVATPTNPSGIEQALATKADAVKTNNDNNGGSSQMSLGDTSNILTQTTSYNADYKASYYVACFAAANVYKLVYNPSRSLSSGIADITYKAAYDAAYNAAIGKGADEATAKAIAKEAADAAKKDYESKRSNLLPTAIPKAQTTANMYAEAIDASGTFSDMGTSRSYMSPTAPVWSAFLSPYYGKSGQNNGDMRTKVIGLSMGATRFLNDQTLFGFSASLSRAMSDADEMDSTATNYAVGMHAMYMFNDSAYIRGQLTGMFGQSDYDFRKDLYGIPLSADANMDSYGLSAQMAVGYSFVFGNSAPDSGTSSAKAQAAQHTVRPELALSYLYNHTRRYGAEYHDGSIPTGYGFSVRSADYDALYADLTVRWTGIFDMDKGTLKPTLKAGVRQALTNPEVSSTMEMFDISTVSHSKVNETSFLCEAGLSWEYNDITLSATYSGEFGNIEYSHMGTLKAEWKF